jgi:hypothetical protein
MSNVSSLVLCAVVPYIVIFFFFALDSQYTFLDVISDFRLPVLTPERALKMSLALLPLYALVAGILYGMVKLLVVSSSSLLIMAWMFVVPPLFIVFMSRLYVVTIHKNYKEYYERCW